MKKIFYAYLALSFLAFCFSHQVKAQQAFSLLSNESGIITSMEYHPELNGILATGPWVKVFHEDATTTDLEFPGGESNWHTITASGVLWVSTATSIWRKNTNNWEEFPLFPNQPIVRIFADGEDIITVGEFQSCGGIDVSGICRFNSTSHLVDTCGMGSGLPLGQLFLNFQPPVKETSTATYFGWIYLWGNKCVWSFKNGMLSEEVLPSALMSCYAIEALGDTIYATGETLTDYGVWQKINGVWSKILNQSGAIALVKKVPQTDNLLMSGSFSLNGVNNNGVLNTKNFTIIPFTTPNGNELHCVAFFPSGKGLASSSSVLYTNFSTSTGMDEPEKEEVSVYPNPAHNYIMFKGANPPTFITNALGQQVQVPFEKQEVKITFDITTLPKGVYLIGGHTIIKE